MILASAVAHAVILAIAVWLPKEWLDRSPPPLVSYTVDLVAPDKLGGSNIVTGGKGRVHAPPMVAAAPAPQAAAKEKPAPPNVEVPKPAAPAELVKPEPPKVEPVKVEPPPPVVEKVEAKPEEPKIEPKPEVPKPEVPKVDAKPEPPKIEPKPEPKDAAKAKADEMALLKAKPSPQIQPTVAREVPSPKAAKAAPTPVPQTTKVDASAVARAEAKKAAEGKAAALKAAAEKAAAEKAAVEKAAVEKAAAEKAAAEKASAEKAAKEAKENAERDSQIAAAIRKVQQRGERGGGLSETPGSQPGGPIAAGPGEGIGGQVLGVEALIYRNMVFKKIQDAWAWAGANQALVASVRFSITESGEIHDVKIDKSSGDRGFDASVERAVRAASPLPPPPEQYRSMFSDFLLDFDSRDLQM